MVVAKALEKLSEQQKSWLIDDCFSSFRIDQTLKKIDMSRREFSKYLEFDQEFAMEYERALKDACVFLENDLLNVHKVVDNHKMATVAMNALCKVLAFRNPEKYGNKIDVSVSVVSIRSNLESANERVALLMGLKDVTPKIG